jgi:hypothetical protein
MIAPAPHCETSADRPERGMASARRALAAVLFNRAGAPKPVGLRVASCLAWALVAWTLAIAFSYFAFGSWWTAGLN